MTTTAETSRTPAHPVWRTVTAVAGLAFVRIRNFALAMYHRRDMETLAHFDDRMLADIGLTRSDIHSALAEPFWRDPGQVLVARAGERRGAGYRSPRGPSRSRVSAPSIVPDAPVMARSIERA